MQGADPFKARREAAGDANEALGGERLLAFLGRAAARNAVLNIRLFRNIRSGLPRSEKDSFQLKPGDRFKKAIQAEEYFQDHYLSFPENAFLAGLHYDWLASVLEIKKGIPSDWKQSLDDAWKEGFKGGLIAVFLAENMKNLPFAAYAFGATAVLPLGRVLMGILFSKKTETPAWKEFLTEVEKYKHLSMEFRKLAEPRRYPFTSSELVSLYVCFFRWFRPVEKAIFHVERPYYLRRVKPAGLDRFASLINIASILAGVRPSPQALPLSREEWKRVGELGLNESQLRAAISAAIEGRAKPDAKSGAGKAS